VESPQCEADQQALQREQVVKKERPHSRDAQSLRARRADYAEQSSPGPLLRDPRPFADEEDAPPSVGWPIWLAWVLGLTGFFLAAIAWMAMGLAALTSLTINQTLLTAVLLGPVVGCAVSLPGLICALLAVRRARKTRMNVAESVTVVSLTTAILIGGLLFGGLVSYPRVRLATFGQAIQTHCARFAQSLQQYGNPPDITTLEKNALSVVTTLQSDESALSDDQATLNALKAPDSRYQPLLDDCRNMTAQDILVSSTLLSELVNAHPDVSAAQRTIAQYQANTGAMLAEIQRLGAALQQQIFAPFHSG
jgi:hypothetical protein